ncbi:hypothetical protein BEE12_16070 [Pantoea agglomerans]|uniref:hypothetical protein n=1 Tax=Enterobacter agglomerans TaxID=549 RepID=UPI00083CBD1B|nr:hypothetical protein [Pantoea agglomerans]AOE41233.1 hypothetical protein BEE12_16070 [Pantoea agglomerans]
MATPLTTTSDVGICSAALMSLGGSPINSFDEDTEGARIVAGVYPLARNELLRAHPWNCAIKRVRLASDAQSPAFGFSNQFTLPGDWIRLDSISNGGVQIYDYKVEGGKILTNYGSIDLLYVSLNDRVETWDAHLVSLMVQLMRAKIAYAVTRDLNAERVASAQYESALKLARAIDGQEDPAQSIGAGGILEARIYGSY